MAKSTKVPKTNIDPATATVAVASTPESRAANLGAAAAERAAAKRALNQSDRFYFIKNPEKPIAPQAACIVNTIASFSEGVLRPELVAALATTLTTRQPPERILGYYQSTLVGFGLIRVDNPNRPVDDKFAIPQEPSGMPAPLLRN